MARNVIGCQSTRETNQTAMTWRSTLPLGPTERELPGAPCADEDHGGLEGGGGPHAGAGAGIVQHRGGSGRRLGAGGAHGNSHEHTGARAVRGRQAFDSGATSRGARGGDADCADEAAQCQGLTTVPLFSST
jgi:hypothetical protein